LRLDAHQEDEAKLSDLHFIATLQSAVVYAASINVCSVEAASISQTPAFCAMTEFGMATTYRDVVEKNVRLWCATHTN
jgi:hypothetical protein